MKKSLVLAMAMALGVTASAYAANPFSDVPAGHWAYDSVAKLAAAGVVDGYVDGSFGGDKLMTRYEMAQIVAKAMAKGANVDKLAAEFADELDTLGVRVANLEKKADNVKITGQVRYRYTESDLNGNGNTMRNRIWVNGQINEDWSYTGMLQNVQNFDNNAGDEDTDFQRAYVDGRIGGLDVRAGRYNMFIADGNIYDTRADGIEVSYGKDVKVVGYVGKATDDAYSFANDTITGADSFGDYAGVEVFTNVAKGVKLSAGYMNFEDMHPNNPVFGGMEGEDAIWYAGLGFNFGDVALTGMYLKADADTTNPVWNAAVTDEIDDDGYVVGLTYKGVKASEVGSYGLWAKYYDQGGHTYVAHTTDANVFGRDGFKGYGVGMDYAVAKNITAGVAYYDTESKFDDEDDQILLGEVYFNF